MSDSEQDASILGKRARNVPGADGVEDADMNPPPNTQDDEESDDDVGPMPMPEGAAVNTSTKKKRKGSWRSIARRTVLSTVFHLRVVLPHERLFLDHLPSADRYHKSFMHRDVINFVVVTRCVPSHNAKLGSR